MCKKNHTERQWCSQPVMNRGVHFGDLMIASACLLSGNNFAKVHLWAQMCNLNFLSTSVYHRIQGHYMVPSIEEFWAQHQADLYGNLQGKELLLMGMLNLIFHFTLNYLNVYRKTS